MNLIGLTVEIHTMPVDDAPLEGRIINLIETAGFESVVLDGGLIVPWSAIDHLQVRSPR